MKPYTSNSLQHFTSKMSPQITPDIPMKVYLDLTEDCNMYCIMCREKIINEGRIMDINLFKRLVNETCEGTTSYSIFNWGESLILKDIKERIDYLISKKLPEAFIDISTNGTYLSEEMSRFLLERNVEITVSFDGSNKNTFEKLRRGSNFNQICKNLKKAVEIANEKNIRKDRKPGIYTSIQKDNWKEIADIVKLAKELGVERIAMGPVVGPEEFRAEVTEEFVNKISEAINYAEENDMYVDMFPTKLEDYVWEGNKYVKAEKYLIDKTCNAPFTSISIKWNGEAYLCCNVGDFVEKINNKSFSEVWNGERYKELRINVNKDEKIPRMCLRCPWVNRY